MICKLSRAFVSMLYSSMTNDRKIPLHDPIPDIPLDFSVCRSADQSVFIPASLSRLNFSRASSGDISSSPNRFHHLLLSDGLIVEKNAYATRAFSLGY
jgi:hypothetical protein